MKTTVDEIAPDLYRFSTYVRKIELQFNQFLVLDDEPLLYHTGLRGMFPEVRDAVAKVVDVAKIRWIGFSHFEADECGSLNEWFSAAPQAQAICGAVGALVNINDFTGRKARTMAGSETLETGKRRFRFLETPHVPHGWDASLLFEETGATLFCSDLLLQNGDCRPVTGDDVVPAAREALLRYEAGPLAHPYPYTPTTECTLLLLAAMEPKLLATMHGSAFSGDGAAALRGLAATYDEILKAPLAQRDVAAH